jgi:hypothetical protein
MGASPPLSTWADWEFRLEVFKLLRADKTIFVQEFEHKRDIIAGFRGHSAGELRQALHDLTTQGLATQVQHDIYGILDKGLDMNPDEYLYSLIKDLHEDTVNQVAKLDKLWLLSSALATSLFLSAYVVLLWGPLGSQSIFVATAVGMLAVMVFVARQWWFGRHDISREKRLADKLLDAYLLLRDKDDRVNTEKAVKKVSASLRRPSRKYVWDTLNRDRENLTQVGVDLATTLVPAMTDKAHSKSDLSEAIVRIASLLFEGSPESIGRALSKPSVFGDLPRKKEPEKEVTPSIREQLGRWRQRSFLRFAVAFACLSVVVYVAGSVYAWHTGTSWQPTTTDFVTYFIAIVVGAAAAESKFAHEPSEK